MQYAEHFLQNYTRPLHKEEITDKLSSVFNTTSFDVEVVIPQKRKTIARQLHVLEKEYVKIVKTESAIEFSQHDSEETTLLLPPAAF